MFTVLFGKGPLIMSWLDVCSLKATTASAPASPVLVSKPRPLSMALPSSNSPPLGSPTTPTYMPKKRRAPQPPILVSQSSSDLSARRRLNSEPNAQLDSDQVSGLCGLLMAAMRLLCLAASIIWLHEIVCHLDRWIKSWVLSWVFTEENQTQSSSTPHDPQRCCPRSSSDWNRKSARFVFVCIH